MMAAAAAAMRISSTTQPSKKESVLSKRRKFESLMADMVSKNSRSISSHSTTEHFLSDDIEKSPFTKLMQVSVTGSPVSATYASPSSKKSSSNSEIDNARQFSFFSFPSTPTKDDQNKRGVEQQAEDSPMGKRRRDSTYDTLQNLRLKAKRNLEILDSSSRQEHRETTRASSTDTGVEDGNGKSNVAPTRKSQDYIMGSCSSLLKEKRQKSKQEHQEPPTASNSQEKILQDPKQKVRRKKKQHASSPEKNSYRKPRDSPGSLCSARSLSEDDDESAIASLTSPTFSASKEKRQERAPVEDDESSSDSSSSSDSDNRNESVGEESSALETAIASLTSPNKASSKEKPATETDMREFPEPVRVETVESSSNGSESGERSTSVSTRHNKAQLKGHDSKALPPLAPTQSPDNLPSGRVELLSHTSPDQSERRMSPTPDKRGRSKAGSDKHDNEKDRRDKKSPARSHHRRHDKDDAHPLRQRSSGRDRDRGDDTNPDKKKTQRGGKVVDRKQRNSPDRVDRDQTREENHRKKHDLQSLDHHHPRGRKDKSPSKKRQFGDQKDERLGSPKRRKDPHDHKTRNEDKLNNYEKLSPPQKEYQRSGDDRHDKRRSGISPDRRGKDRRNPSPTRGGYRDRKQLNATRGDKYKDSEPVIIRIIDTELEEEKLRSRFSSHARPQNKPVSVFSDLRKDVDNRLMKLKERLNQSTGRYNQTYQQPIERKISTFVEDMKQGKNFRESLRHFRKTAAKSKKTFGGRVHPPSQDEEIIFVDDLGAYEHYGNYGQYKPKTLHRSRSPENYHPSRLDRKKTHREARSPPPRANGAQHTISRVASPRPRTPRTEEIIFVDDVKGVYYAPTPTRKSRSPPKSREIPKARVSRHKVTRTNVYSPLTMEEALMSEQQSTQTYYTTAPSELMTKPSIYSNFVGAQILCSDDSILTDSFAGMSIGQNASRRPPPPEAEIRTPRAEISSPHDRRDVVPSPCTRRRESLTASPQKKNGYKETTEMAHAVPQSDNITMQERSVVSDAGQENMGGFPRQISTLLHSVGAHLVPSVPSGFLASLHPPSPKWAIQQEHDFAEGVMSITESMGLQLRPNNSTAPEKLVELKLRSMEERMDREARHKEGQVSVVPGEEQNLFMAEVEDPLIERYRREKHERAIQNRSQTPQREEDLNLCDLKQQLSDLSDALVSEAQDGICQRYCQPPTDTKSPKIPPENIVSSSPIISQFLNRKNRENKVATAGGNGRVTPSAAKQKFTIESPVSALTGPSGGRGFLSSKPPTRGKTARSPARKGKEPPTTKGKEPPIAGKELNLDEEEESLSEEFEKNKALFGKHVSPLTLPPGLKFKVSNAAPRHLPPPRPPVPRDDRRLQNASGKQSSLMDNLLQRPLHKRQSEEEDPSSTSAWSKSGRESKSGDTENQSSDFSSLGASTQTGSFGSSFMTSVVLKHKDAAILQKMSSVSESMESSQSRSSQSSQSSESQGVSEHSPHHPPPLRTSSLGLTHASEHSPYPPPLMTTSLGLSHVSEQSPYQHLLASRKQDPPSIRPEDPVAKTEPPDQPMSCSRDSKISAESKEESSSGSRYADLEGMAGMEGGNPLKKLLSRPRAFRRNNTPSNNWNESSSSEENDRSSNRKPSTKEKEPKQQQQQMAQGRACLGKEQDLTRLQTWMGACNGAPPGDDPQEQPSLGGTVDNIDNLVLASWGLQNKMDQLRMSLTFSPSASVRSPGGATQTTAAVATHLTGHTVAKQPPSSAAVDAVGDTSKIRNIEDENSVSEEGGMISSVSETTTYSTLGTMEDADFSRATNYDEHKGETTAASRRNIGKSHTMETDGAYFRGDTRARTSQASHTPKAVLAFRSKSWKLDDEDESDNSLVLSDNSGDDNMSKSAEEGISFISEYSYAA